MNSRINILKDCIIDHLRKRVDFDEKNLRFFSLPYSLNLTGEGIENFLSALVNISLDKLSIIAYLKSDSENSRIYDYNNSQVYEVSPSDNHNLRDEYGSLLCRCVESAFRNCKMKNGINAAVYDDFDSSSLSSPSLKFTSVISALCNANNQTIDGKLFNLLFKETDSNLLSINLDRNEILSYEVNLENKENSQEKLHWSDFNTLKVIQISFEKKRLRNEIESNFINNLTNSHDLLKVLMASARVKSLAEFSEEQIISFVKRVPAEKKNVINYLYRESVISKKCVDSLRTKNFESFIKSVNHSGINLTELGIINPGIEKLFYSLQDNNEILAIKISPSNSSLTCFLRSSDEQIISSEIQQKIAVLFPDNKSNINIYSSNITGIYIYTKN